MPRKFTFTCLGCNVQVTKANATTFCSINCHRKHQQDSFIAEWKKGNIPPEKTFQKGMHNTISRRIRNYLFQKYDHQCCQCGWNKVNPKTGFIPLQVEHIDGDSLNNKEDNLLLLCPNCHSLTPTFGALNKGKGRKGRTAYRKRIAGVS